MVCSRNNRAFYVVELVMAKREFNRRTLLKAGALLAVSTTGSACRSDTQRSDDSTGSSSIPPLSTTEVRSTSALSISRSATWQSGYLPMRDGVRIAVDVWLPGKAKDQKIPTLIRATRYQRAANTGSSDPAKNSNAEEAKRWMDLGYGLLIVDARGSGASFGMRTSELSPDEVQDYGEIIEWIGTQPWSNGRVGSYGVSYDGDTAEHMARYAGKHLVAIAPQFSDFDPWRQTIYPGGAFFAPFMNWLSATQALDEIPGALERVAQASGVSVSELRATQFPGVAPVDGPDGKKQLAEAIREHAKNAVLDLGKLDFRDDPRWDNSAVPTYRDELEASGVAVFVQAGWLDAGTVVGTLERFSTFDMSQDVWVGPWPHGGGNIIDTTFSKDKQPSFADLDPEAQFGRLAAFFDTYVRDGEPPTKKKTLRFTTLNSSGWTETTQWPVAGTSDQTMFATGKALQPAKPISDEQFAVPSTPHTTGPGSRWVGQLGSPVSYPDWLGSASSRLTFVGDAAPEPLTIAGFPVVTTTVKSSDVDGVLYAYLQLVRSDGTVYPVTEGSLRLVHRGKTQPKVNTSARLERTFVKADMQPMVPGEPVEVTFELLPISVRFNAGDRLQLSFASSDTDNFQSYSKPGSQLTLLSSADQPLRLVIPVAPTTNASS